MSNLKDTSSNNDIVTQVTDTHITVPDNNVQVNTNNAQVNDTNIKVPTNNIQVTDTRITLPSNSIQIIATSDFKNKIINDYLRPSYLKDIEQKIYGRVFWTKVSNRIMVLSKIILIFVSVFAFAGSKFTNLWWLSFISGILSVSALSLMQFSMFASHESKDCTNDVNIMLTSLNMDNSKIPDLDINNNDKNDS